MSREAFERGNRQAVIEAHPLESHDPGEWLRYGVALRQTITPGPDVGKQQQQAALAFVQAQKEGATAEGVSREIWTELLLNGCAASEAQLPALQLVESRSLPRSGHHFLRHLLG